MGGISGMEELMPKVVVHSSLSRTTADVGAFNSSKAETLRSISSPG